MSYGSLILTQCEDLQDNLDVYWSTCDAETFEEATPFYDFMMSDMNNMGLEQVVVPGQGKIRTINLKYFQRINEDNVSALADPDNCDATTKRGDCVEPYTMDENDNLQVEEFIERKDLVRVCRDNGEYLTIVMDRLMSVIERRVATKTTSEAVALVGKYDAIVDSNPETTVNVDDQLVVRTLRSGTTDEVSPFTMQQIDIAAMQTGYCSAPICFADVSLFQYYQRVLAGCCANQGVDLGTIAREFGKAVVYDRRIAAAFGSNVNLMTQAGAMQILRYANNAFYDEGVMSFIGRGSLSAHLVLFTAKGLPIDVNILEQPCGGINIVATATTKLVSVPDDMFGTGDTKDGVKFINEILVDNS